ncbi:hypothetical protein SCHPADRAFT_446431 [Schizopora paradoxa]|uniref:Uncharacterized protein n=1 Tax=Schizopora paradoxa TaxID=27342 RepID=A0A0H2RR51_9AGAM|nr:hypothetical protein SCHPADRAFT_446431 [Schizopora paradoxa]
MNGDDESKIDIETKVVPNSNDSSEAAHQLLLIPTPRCDNLVETAEAVQEREKLNALILLHPKDNDDEGKSPLEIYLRRGFACTVGSALEETPPSDDDCLNAFLVPNRIGLTAGARAWTKHAHRSGNSEGGVASETSWWGQPKGPLAVINEKAIALFWKIMANVTWRNLHWLPHQVLVYEVRILEGYGMRWSKDMSKSSSDGDTLPWQFRGYVEPMMENGHELGWRH